MRRASLLFALAFSLSAAAADAPEAPAAARQISPPLALEAADIDWSAVAALLASLQWSLR